MASHRKIESPEQRFKLYNKAQLRIDPVNHFLRNLRDCLDLRQNEIAKLLHITPSAWNQYEHGKRRPCIKVGLRLVKLSKRKGMNIKLDDIYST